MDTFSDILLKTPLVIDNGSGEMKAGIAGDERPSLAFPTYVGRPKYEKVMQTQEDFDICLGPKAEKNLGMLKLKYPMSHGVVNNWSDMEIIWKYIYSELKSTPKEHPVLLTDAPLNPIPNRVQLCKIFFENFGAPAVFIGVTSLLSLYANGKTTGVVLDSGDGVTTCMPVYNGYAIQHATQRIDIGGRDITENLMLQLRKSGYVFHTSSEFENVKKMKEKLCDVNVKEEKLTTGDKEKYKLNYILPDGTSLELLHERFRPPELMFAPEKIGLEYPGVHELLVNSVKKCDIDLRKTLFNEVILAGGTTLLHGFGDRLLAEAKKIAPKDLRLRIYAAPERKYTCWLGGAILSNLDSFKKMWITKKDFEEQGERILMMKSL
jgi:centractin